MQLKEIHRFVEHLVKILQLKEESQRGKKSLPKEIKEYTKGQLYEAQYILGIIEKIIYENQTYNY
jgi:hypothetical protein